MNRVGHCMGRFKIVVILHWDQHTRLINSCDKRLFKYTILPINREWYVNTMHELFFNIIFSLLCGLHQYVDPLTWCIIYVLTGLKSSWGMTCFLATDLCQVELASLRLCTMTRTIEVLIQTIEKEFYSCWLLCRKSPLRTFTSLWFRSSTIFHPPII